jgi:hypothetical protein
MMQNPTGNFWEKKIWTNEEKNMGISWEYS